MLFYILKQACPVNVILNQVQDDIYGVQDDIRGILESRLLIPNQLACYRIQRIVGVEAANGVAVFGRLINDFIDAKSRRIARLFGKFYYPVVIAATRISQQVN